MSQGWLIVAYRVMVVCQRAVRWPKGECRRVAARTPAWRAPIFFLESLARVARICRLGPSFFMGAIIAAPTARGRLPGSAVHMVGFQVNPRGSVQAAMKAAFE